MAKKLNSEDTQDLENARAQVGAVDEQATSWKNILSLKLQANKAAKEELDLRQKIASLGKEEARKAIEYKETTLNIKNIEKDLQTAKENGNRRAENFFKRELAVEQRKQAEQKKTAGGALMAMSLEARNKKIALQAEKQLIKDINKERGIGAKLTDLFRTKEAKQRSIDIARAKVGGGTNTGPGTASSKGLGDSFKESKLGQGIMGSIGGMGAALQKLKAPIGELGNQLKAGLTAPFADAASLLTGEAVGMGGGKTSAAGATSILGGLSKIASSIPVIGGLLGGLVDAFKAMVDAVLGVDQANFKVARSMNISAGAADQMRKNFDKVASASDNIVVNSTRMLESQIELGNQLGINKQLSSDILVNDVKLKDILGLEAESRKVISDQAMATGRNAAELTKSAIGTVSAFNKLVGTSFKWSSILSEASKLTGVMGLTLTKFPEKIYNAVTATKALGFGLQQLDSTAESFLDFEGSISKEMEAQVLTGKALNLTAAREAALNNDNVTLAKEITKNVGDANSYLKMNRIQQDAIAQSVGLTRDSLADILKKQVIYNRANVTDEQGLVRKLDLLEKQGVKQKEISKILGEDGYKTATQVSTAEKLSEIMERIKKVFVDFVRTSGLFEFLTSPEKINNFIKGMADKLASAISMIGDIIATMLEGVSHLPFTDTEKWQGLAAQVRSGSGGLSDSIRSTTNSLGGVPAGSISDNVQQNSKQSNTAAANLAASGNNRSTEPTTIVVYTTVDGEVIAKSSTKHSPAVYGQTTR